MCKIIYHAQNTFLTAVCLLLASTSSAQTAKTAIQYYDQGIKLPDTEKYTEALAAFKMHCQNPGYKRSFTVPVDEQ
ncbi:MAG: hypothetical protein IPO42_10740 [Chitinophagaceae bacterium]|nr:hypothetical protein [Chitinophagaceae bacterium]